jgi:hypothetical protein
LRCRYSHSRENEDYCLFRPKKNAFLWIHIILHFLSLLQKYMVCFIKIFLLNLVTSIDFSWCSGI